MALIRNLLFLLGSILFLKKFAVWETTAVWTFIVGSSLVLVGIMGELAKAVYENRRHKALKPLFTAAVPAIKSQQEIKKYNHL